MIALFIWTFTDAVKATILVLAAMIGAAVLLALAVDWAVRKVRGKK